MVSSATVASILGGRQILRRDVRTFSDLERLVAAGLPVRSLQRTVNYITPDKKSQARLADRIVPRVTRRRRTTQLRPDESEKVERLARAMALAEYVWESHKAAQQFMATPHGMLGGRTPLDATATELGTRQVEDLLWKLEYSLPV